MNEKRTRGRPKGTVGNYKVVKKDIQVAFRVTQSQKERLQKDAAECGMTQSEYILKKLF